MNNKEEKDKNKNSPQNSAESFKSFDEEEDLNFEEIKPDLNKNNSNIDKKQEDKDKLFLLLENLSSFKFYANCLENINDDELSSSIDQFDGNIIFLF